MISGETEAAFMRAQLMAQGVNSDDILCEASSTNTEENLRRVLPLIRSVSPRDQSVNVVLVTGGFHLVRTLRLIQLVFAGSPWLQVFPLPAYGPHTAPDSWHLSEEGRTVIGNEIAKLLAFEMISGKRSLSR